MPVAAVAAIGAVGSVAAGAMQSSAAKKAAGAQERASERSAQAIERSAELSTGVQRDVATQARIDAYPWALAGANALYQYMDELGVARPQNPILPDLTQGPFALGGQAQQTQQTQQQAQTLGQAAGGAGAGGPFDDSHPFGNLLNRFSSLSKPQSQNPNYEYVWDQNAEDWALVPAVGAAQQGTAPAQQEPASAFQSPSDIEMTEAKGFQETPGYQFMVQEGERGVLNNLAAMGMKNSGSALKALSRFRTGLASQERGNYLNRLASMAGMGQTQTNQTSGLAQNAATNIGNIQTGAGANLANAYQNAGAARASGYVGSANAWGNAIGGVTNSLGNALGMHYAGGFQ